MSGVKRAAAGTAAALMLLTGPLSVFPVSAQPSTAPPKSNSQPPALPGNFPLPPPGTGGTPAPDVPYKRNNKSCIGSNTNNTPITQMSYGQLYLNLDQAHRFATGKGQSIAIIDTGVEKHPRLQGRVQGLGDFVGSGGEKSDGTSDCDGHGTEVAGVAAASPDADTPFVGAAPDANILAIRQTSDRFEFEGNANEEKRTTAGKIKTLAQAIVTAANANAKVINISLTNCGAPKGFSDDDRTLQAAIKFAVDVKNAVIVTAAGNLGDQNSGCNPQNDNPDPNKVNVIASPPWFSEDVLSVASINRSGIVSDFSVWGPWVSIAGPGEEIVTIDPKGTALTNANVNPENQQPVAIRGTSFASPYVAGVAALVRERFPDLTAREVMNRLKATAQHPGNATGRDNKVGHGMVNPVAALTAVIPGEGSNSKPTSLAPLATQVNPPVQKDWNPIIVALGGTGIAVSLLLLTLFVMHTVNRNRGRTA